MQNKTRLAQYCFGTLILTATVLGFTGCQSKQTPSDSKPVAAAPTTIAAPAPTPVAIPKPAMATIRIRAGEATALTDSSGNVWLPDQGFADGETTSRDASLQIENTKDPALYRGEHYSMTAFSHPLPNGKYTVKLHFAETYEGITGPGQRVFSFNVEGQEVKDFDVWAKAGGGQRAYVETVKVDVADGKLDIAFKSNIENPEINGIEIIPGS